MAKDKKKQPKAADEDSKVSSFSLQSTAVDPSLASLFASSLGKATPRARPAPITRANGGTDDLPDSDDDDDASDGTLSSVSAELEDNDEPATGTPTTLPSRKRKRKGADHDIEADYLNRLARDEEKEISKRKKARLDSAAADGRTANQTGKPADGEEEASRDSDSGSGAEASDYEIPQHESVSKTQDEIELDKAARTVFLGNVSSAAIKSKSSKKALTEHLSSFLSTLPESKPPSKLESLRFRSTAFASASVPKKAAFAKKELMDATTRSTNAYAVYTTAAAAREAVKQLNGSVVLDRHLRVDSVAHPAKIDHRRCVFVGNLGFVDDESMIKAAEEGKDAKTRNSRSKEPSDAEEGLWRQFSLAGEVESVRVVRDKTTRVGKGFAYVQFKDGNGVEKALLFNDKKYPPLLPRKLRVTRAKSITKTASHSSRDRPQGKPAPATGVYRPKPTSESQSLAGRAGKLLGRAGAAKFRNVSGASGQDNPRDRPREQRLPSGIKKTPESFVFEGHRATESQGKGSLKLGKTKKKSGGKAGPRRTTRSVAFKKGGAGKAR